MITICKTIIVGVGLVVYAGLYGLVMAAYAILGLTCWLWIPWLVLAGSTWVFGSEAIGVAVLFFSLFTALGLSLMGDW